MIVDHGADWRQTAAELASAGLNLSRDSAAARFPRGFSAEEVGRR